MINNKQIQNKYKIINKKDEDNNIMNNNKQQWSSSTNSSFALIWYYWFRKYMNRKNKKSGAFYLQLNDLKNKYRIQSIETVGSNSNLLKKRIEQVKQKLRVSHSQPQHHNNIALQQSTSNSATTNNTNSPPLLYTINPQLQAKEIQEILNNQGEEGHNSYGLDKQEIKQMINQLHCYYLNSKTVFIIYKQEREKEKQKDKQREKQKDTKQKQKDNLSLNIRQQGSTRINSFNINLNLISNPNSITNISNQYQNSLLNSRINPSSLILNSDDELGGIDRNDSILESLDKMQDKIENLQILDKFVELDGLEIWNAKYHSIPHCFVKIKKNCWAKTLNQNTINGFSNNNSNLSSNSNNNVYSNSFSNNNASIIIHPSQPRTVSNLPIIPRINRHKPSIDKLKPFVSYMQQLWQKNPNTNLSPTCQSIFQYNRLPYIFTQDMREQDMGVLCFYIVYGNQQENLTQKYVDKWMENNSNSMLAKMIRYTRQRVKNRNSSLNQKQIAIKGLFQQGDGIW